MAYNQAIRLDHLVRHEEDPDILQTSGQEIKTFLTNVPEEATVAQSPVSYSSTPLYRDPPRKRQYMKGMLQIYQAPSQATNSVPDRQAEPPTTEDDPVNDVPKNVPNDAEDFGSSDEDFDADSGQEMKTTLTNGPGPLCSSSRDTSRKQQSVEGWLPNLHRDLKHDPDKKEIIDSYLISRLMPLTGLEYLQDSNSDSEASAVD
mgnify:CR=1 FL=1